MRRSNNIVTTDFGEVQIPQEFSDYANSLNPGRIQDKRTKAYKYMQRAEKAVNELSAVIWESGGILEKVDGDY